MKKHGVFALAGLACAFGASAQVGGTGAGAVTSSNVTLFGVVDAAVAWGDGSVNSNTRLVSGANTASRLGFRGVEDLGGGLGAGFWLEMGVNADDGTGQASNSNNQPSGAGVGGAGVSFNRRSTVSLMGDWGELRLGRDFVATFRNRDQVDPFSTSGVGDNQADAGSIVGVTSTRASNMIGYFLPAHRLGGFFGEAQYYMGENAGNSDGDGFQARLGWAGGNFGIAGAYGKTKYTQSATIGDTEVWNVGVHYDFGFARLSAGYYDDRVKQAVERKATGYLVGAVVPFGASVFKASFSSYDIKDTGATRKLALGYQYNLSKRTAAYATYAHVDNRGQAAVGLNGSTTEPGKNSDGVDIGLKHSF